MRRNPFFFTPMNHTRTTTTRRRLRRPDRASSKSVILPMALLLAAVSAPSLSLQAQSTAPEAAETTPGATPRRAPQLSPADVRATRSALNSDDTVVLSPFEINTDKDDGFAAVNAGTATKLGIDMKDLAAPYSVMTGEFIKAVGITNLQEAATWSTNGSPVIDAQGADLFLAPSMYNIRGQVVNAGQQRNFFLTASTSDAYAVERIDFGRGPNAVLFNVGANTVLGGGISVQTKRARVDDDFEEVSLRVGSWDSYRATLDINKRLSDKLAIRGNAVWQDDGGWLVGEFSRIKGITLASTYRFAEKTELRIEFVHDRVERSNPAGPFFDNISGWDGVTVFDGPITNLMYPNTGTPGRPNTFGQTLTYEGSPQGVWRENNPSYVYVPGQGMVMNYIHTASTRRGDENSRVPIYSGGQTWTRNGNDNLLPFGNTGGQGRPSVPGPFYNGAEPTILYARDLPGDRFGRQISNSNFRIPSKRYTTQPDVPLFTERTTGAQLAFTHQLGENLFFELSGDANRVEWDSIWSINWRRTFIDVNMRLPDGSLNPHFLDPYTQSDLQRRGRKTDNAGIRANLAYIKDLGKWGHYTFNVTAAASERKFESRFRTVSMGLAADPREWQGQRLQMRYYWTDDARPFDGGLPTTLFQKTVVPGTAGSDNTYQTATLPVQPRWVLFDWWNEQQRSDTGVFAMAAKWFGGKVVATGGLRYDDQVTKLRNPAVRFGGLPVNASWDGLTLDDRYFKPNAPADWKTLTFIPKNADGTPRSAVPLPAIDRPTVPGANGVNPFNPVYANDRFRNDYNPPPGMSQTVNTTYGIMYHALSWLSLHANYGESHLPMGVNRWRLDFSEADPEKGVAYDAGFTLNLFQERLALKAGYFFNRREKILGNYGPVVDNINGLMRRQPINDGSPEGRNALGYSDVLGADYFAQKNGGYELEVVGRITRNWRLTANYGFGRVDDYDRYNSTQAYVDSRKQEMLEVLQAAGGMLDTSRKPVGSTSAPGLAVVNPNVTHARGADYQLGAVNNYNNVWVGYDQIPTLQDFIGIKRGKINVFTDYSFDEGMLKGLRVGLGAQYSDKVIAGYRAGDTIANPNYNPNLPVTENNRPWVDNPDVDANTPVWIKQPFDVIGTLTYKMRLKSRYRILEGKELEFHLVVKNLLNKQAVIHQDEGVTLRPPDGDFSLPYREAVPSRIGLFQRPINFELTATLRL
jgi:hypothetical protein